VYLGDGLGSSYEMQRCPESYSQKCACIKTIGETTNRNSGRPQEGRTRTAKKGIIEFVRGAVKVVNQDLRGQALYGAWASAEADKAACGPTFLRRVVFTCGRSYTPQME
jgi:hypothetical protein